MGRKNSNQLEKFRKINFLARNTRPCYNMSLDEDLMYGLVKIAKEERKSLSWLVETALSDYFGVTVMLRKLKGKPKPALRMHDNMRVVKRRA